MDFRVLLLCITVLTESAYCKSSLRIGIIGGGIGGCTTAWFLRQELQNSVEIIVFEKDRIGGRVASVELNGHEYDAGAAIYHESNKHLKDFMSSFDLKSMDDNSDNEINAISNDTDILFQTSGSWFMDAAKALWRYGFSPLKLGSWVNDYVSRFVEIYGYQARNCSYSRPVDLILAADPAFIDLFYVPLKSHMLTDGFNERFIDEMAEGATRVNYNQRTSLPAFVGSISLAGMTGPIYSIKGGNRQVAVHACQAADSIISDMVSTIELLSNQQFRIHTAGTYQDFDFVVLAAPLQRDTVNVIFRNFPDFFQPSAWIGSYQRTVATFVEGKLNHTFFGSSHYLDMVINVAPAPRWSSIGTLKDVSGNSSTTSGFPMWKIFSSLPLGSELLNAMFSETFGSLVVDWKAYPNYAEPPREPPPFNLFGHLCYLNAIEWAGSAMEMSLIAAKNIALNIAGEITGVKQKNCPSASKGVFDKTEL